MTEQQDLAATRAGQHDMEMNMQLEQRSIPFDKIETNVCGFNNPRTYLGDISDLVSSIEEEGLLVNPTVWETIVKGKTRYIVLLGHRRMEAVKQIREKAEQAGEEVFDEVTCSVTENDLEGAMSIALIDHVHNETLNPADTAQAVAKLVEKTGNQTKVGEMLSKSQPWVSIYLNLYKGLIPAALEALRVGNLKVNQAKKLAAMLNPDKTPDIAAQEAALERILKKEPAEPTEQGGEKPRQRAKTHRAKREVEALRVRLAEMDKDNGEVDAEYRAVVAKVVSWYFCQIDDEEVSFSSPEVAAANPKVEEEEEEVVEAPKKKRRARKTKAQKEAEAAEKAAEKAAEQEAAGDEEPAGGVEVEKPAPKKKRKRRIANSAAA
jgi:ParB/RepB/Spo0J family partition protein